ncbi:Asp-tRNA(Asn)/Glu-tRNA(Gln) amidotransferase subunit GatC [Candidatus Nomurabacteria bacterium]|nr:Asp-tRNA(Asn)/Glu-tRNA(Gln) amidotransferase subunit GatC [Candidatus Nomurabacteria bacterium]
MEIKDIENLAEMSKIELSEEEKVSLLSDMAGILDYVKQIEMLEVPDIEPEYVNKNIWREDEILMKDFSKDLIIKQFPDSQDDYVKVKKIL